MDINSYENLLSFEGNFVTLHAGTVFNCLCMFCLLALAKIQSNYYRTNFFLLFISLHLHFYVLFGNFVPQPDEEAGSAEEQPASNMAVPALEAVLQEPPRPWAAY
jgi:hypothetical protein